MSAITAPEEGMAEVLVVFTTLVSAADGRRYEPRACGGLTADGLYEGWVEFVPAGVLGESVRTPRETLQPNRADLVYWATGLTQTYLDGALRRALAEPRVVEQERAVPVVFDRPAPSRVSPPRGVRLPHAVLNPYEVYQQGESVLVAELGALDAGLLRDIVLDYGLAPREAAERASAGELTRMIVDGVVGRGTVDEERPAPRAVSDNH
jgi:hypothetical protein